MEADRQILIQQLTKLKEKPPKKISHDMVLFVRSLLTYLTDPDEYEQSARPIIGEQEHEYVVRAAQELEIDTQRDRILGPRR